jgi:hypothetical protein
VWVILLTAAPAFSAGRPEEVQIQIRREGVLAILQAATPYSLEVGAGLLRQNLVFSEPAGIRFEAGRVGFSVRCQGSPFPVDQVLHPVFTFRRQAAAYQLVLESLPVSVPGFGSVDLKDLFRPVDLDTILRQGLSLPRGPTVVELKVVRIGVRADGVEVGASLRFGVVAGR